MPKEPKPLSFKDAAKERNARHMWGYQHSGYQRLVELKYTIHDIMVKNREERLERHPDIKGFIESGISTAETIIKWIDEILDEDYPICKDVDCCQ